VVRPLRATNLENGKVGLSGSFGVFFSGRLVAHFYSDHGSDLGSSPVADVDPSELVTLQSEIATSGKAGRVSLHLEDSTGLDRGSLQEIRISTQDAR
jgi:hypothetical protein